MSGNAGRAVPETMRAAVYRGPRDVAVEERPVPELGPRDVLVEVSHCGVCGSDLHMFVDGWGAPNSIGGHEYSGRVLAVGDDVRDWSPGDEVVGGPSQRCGECEYCLAGRPQLCTGRSNPGVGAFQGAFANFVRVHEAELLRVPPGLSMRAAALAEPLAVALHGLTRGGVEVGQRVLVTGCGPIGALSIAAARARGVTEIVASEPHPTRQALAERLGATVVTPDELPKPRMPFDLVDDPFDVALECSGHGVAMESALSQLKRGGTLVLVGAGMTWPRFDNNRILLNELVITGAFVYDPDGFPRALELLASPDFPTDVLIESEDVPLEGLYDAVERLVSGELPAKVLIAPNRGNGGAR
ncbi:MAG TPA: alcohol dehydrogenase catalytic domain-containing protein [Acidimicrobiia bacterium]|nr:alcohol dehydrogenase catalytic domain-containing protein [Acidimicrobiia bacterium]